MYLKFKYKDTEVIGKSPPNKREPGNSPREGGEMTEPSGEKVDLFGGTVTITKPTGEEIRIGGTTVCCSTSLEKCWRMHPEMINLLIDAAWHRG